VLLAIDVGNTQSHLGIFDGDDLAEHWRFATDAQETADELAVRVSTLLALRGMRPGQVEGSVWMGLGQALQEEMVWKDGLLMNPGLLEYRSPSSVESPDVECIIVESVDPEGPFGAKEASEGSLAATIPAIANAIYDAVGVRLREAPFTPERVLAALRAQKPGEKKLNLTEGVDPTAPSRFREHGGSLWFKGKGPLRHELDPARQNAAGPPAQAGGDD